MNNSRNALLAVGAGLAGGLTGYVFSQRWPTDTGLVKQTQEQTEPDRKSGESLKDDNVDADPNKNVDKEISSSDDGEIKDPLVTESEPIDLGESSEDEKIKDREEGENDAQEVTSGTDQSKDNPKEDTKKKNDNKFAMSPLPPFP